MVHARASFPSLLQSCGNCWDIMCACGLQENRRKSHITAEQKRRVHLRVRKREEFGHVQSSLSSIFLAADASDRRKKKKQHMEHRLCISLILVFGVAQSWSEIQLRLWLSHAYETSRNEIHKQCSVHVTSHPFMAVTRFSHIIALSVNDVAFEALLPVFTLCNQALFPWRYTLFSNATVKIVYHDQGYF